MNNELVELQVDFLWKGDVCVAVVQTDGTQVHVESILNEQGVVPSNVDWDMITVLEMYAVAIWMDEMATHFDNGELDH
jgi:hypothetical protein